jgi:hypothetical protein
MTTKLLRLEEVQVLDDCLPETLYQELHLAASRVGWRFGWNTPSNPTQMYWHHEVAGGSKNNTEDRSAEVGRHPLQAFAAYQDWLRTHLMPEGSRTLRFYLNAHTFGTDGWPHTDCDRPGEVTTVLYITPAWQPGWGGETVVFDSKGDISHAVLPRPNRILCFPSDRLHAPRPLSRAFGGLRVVVVVKMGLPLAVSHQTPLSAPRPVALE